MKPKLILVALIAICQHASAQNTSPYWSLAGNSNATSASKLGTTNSNALRLMTKNTERMRIDSNGRVMIGTQGVYGRLTAFNTSSIPAKPWKTIAPLFSGFGENASGSADMVLSMASNTYNARGVFIGKRARGTLANPLAVSKGDLLMSLLASGYDGSKFQNPASIDFVADGTPSAGQVPTRISFVTGANAANRQERMSIGNNGTISLNNAQLRVDPEKEITSIVGRVIINEAPGEVGVPKAQFNIPYSTTAIYVDGMDAGIEAHSDITAIKAIGGEYGVDAYAEESGGIAVNAISNGTNSTGVWSRGTSLGIYAEGHRGVIAKGRYEGVAGYSGGAPPEPFGNSEESSGVMGKNEGVGAGVRGYSVSGVGVNGTSENSYGVYGKTLNTSSYAGYFDGRVLATGGVFTTSDSELKHNVAKLDKALDLIGKLKPKAYEYQRTGVFGAMNLPEGIHYGLIAQEVEEVLPNIVKTSQYNTALHYTPELPDTVGLRRGVAAQQKQVAKAETAEFKAVNYTELIPILVKAVQEQQEEIREAQAEKDALLSRIEKLEQVVNKLSGGQGNFGSLSSAFMSSLTPNPVKGSASIRYSIPDGSSGQLLISDAAGRQVKAISLKGGGTLNLDASTLASGVYNYSLIVNGKKVQTEKMTVLR